MYSSTNCVVFLIGNKVDIVEQNPNLREVNYDEAFRYANENNLIFYETSAFSDFKITESFEDLINSIYNIIK
jgi:hypothetical protein